MNYQQNGTLNNIDIEDIARKLHIKLNAICHKNQLKNTTYKDGGYIINLENSTGNGTHWVCLYIDNNETYYYDSFGKIYPNEVLQFSRDKYITYNSNHIQNINDTYCGFYCLAFLYYMQNNNHIRDKLETFNNMFDDNPLHSLKYLQRYYKTIK